MYSDAVILGLEPWPVDDDGVESIGNHMKNMSVGNDGMSSQTDAIEKLDHFGLLMLRHASEAGIDVKSSTTAIGANAKRLVRCEDHDLSAAIVHYANQKFKHDARKVSVFHNNLIWLRKTYIACKSTSKQQLYSFVEIAYHYTLQLEKIVNAKGINHGFVERIIDSITKDVHNATTTSDAWNRSSKDAHKRGSTRKRIQGKKGEDFSDDDDDLEFYEKVRLETGPVTNSTSYTDNMVDDYDYDYSVDPEDTDDVFMQRSLDVVNEDYAYESPEMELSAYDDNIDDLIEDVQHESSDDMGQEEPARVADDLSTEENQRAQHVHIFKMKRVDKVGNLVIYKTTENETEYVSLADCKMISVTQGRPPRTIVVQSIGIKVIKGLKLDQTRPSTYIEIDDVVYLLKQIKKNNKTLNPTRTAKKLAVQLLPLFLQYIGEDESSDEEEEEKEEKKIVKVFKKELPLSVLRVTPIDIIDTLTIYKHNSTEYISLADCKMISKGKGRPSKTESVQRMGIKLIRALAPGQNKPRTYIEIHDVVYLLKEIIQNNKSINPSLYSKKIALELLPLFEKRIDEIGLYAHENIHAILDKVPRKPVVSHSNHMIEYPDNRGSSLEVENPYEFSSRKMTG